MYRMLRSQSGFKSRRAPDVEHVSQAGACDFLVILARYLGSVASVFALPFFVLSLAYQEEARH